MQPKNQIAEKGMKSLNRATAKVFEEARRKNEPLPVWINGKVEYLVPEQAQIDELMEKVIAAEQTKQFSELPARNK